jgi:ferrous iron transport protein A
MDAAVHPSDSPMVDVGMSLLDLPKGVSALVASVQPHDDGNAFLTDRLAELGFLPGERVRVLAHGPLGREPVAVRVGTATFALRRHEAGCVRVVAERP